MALSSSRLASSLKTKLLADPNVADNDSLTRLCNAIAEAVIDEIKTNGVVSPAGTPVPLTSSPTGGPISGTGKIL